MKTIGVLGGLGPQATEDFEARVHAVAQRLIPIAVESIPPDLQEQFDGSVIALYEGAAGPGARMVAREAVDFPRRQTVDGIVLGCTDLPLLLDQDVAEPSVIDPTQLLAEAAVREAMLEA